MVNLSDGVAPAAIKVMRANLATNPKFQEHFLREARSAAALKLPLPTMLPRRL